MNCVRNTGWRNLVLWALILIASIACRQAAAEQNRIWVDAQGLFSVEARLIEKNEDSVVLQRQDGKRITIAIDNLSERDQEYLEEVEDPQREKSNPLRSTPPPPAEFEPLPVLDLPPADRVADDGSSLRFVPARETKPVTDLPAALVPDASPVTFSVFETRIPIRKVDVNEICSRPIPVLTMNRSGTPSTSIAMSISSGIQIPGQRQRNQLVLFDIAEEKVRIALQLKETVRLMDHHADSGRSLVLVGFNSLGEGGELAIGTGWDSTAVTLRHRRTLEAKKQGLSLPHVRWARWIDEEHFLAVIDHTLGLWNIISGEQVYGIEGIDPRAEPAISGGRRYVAIPSQGAVDLFATATGQPLGRIVVENRVPSVAFSPYGNALAVVTSRRMRHWDLPSATLSADIESRRSLGGDPPIWIDSDLVLSSSGVLLSAFRRQPVWRYDTVATESAAIGNHVVLLRKVPFSELTIVSLPHQDAIEAMQWINNSVTQPSGDDLRPLGHSVWDATGWADEESRISRSPDRQR